MREGVGGGVKGWVVIIIIRTYYIVKMTSYSQQMEVKEKRAGFQKLLFNNTDFNSYKSTWEVLSDDNKKKIMLWFYDKNPNSELIIDDIPVPPEFIDVLTYIKKQNKSGGSRRRRRPSRKYKKSAKRVFRKKSRSTRRR